MYIHTTHKYVHSKHFHNNEVRSEAHLSCISLSDQAAGVPER